jgi:nucleotide-binding universal stress UspA family protein
MEDDALGGAVKKILVPVDGSRLSEEALAPALALAARRSASLELVHVVPDLSTHNIFGAATPETFQSWLAGEEARGRAYLERLRGELEPGSPVSVGTHLLVSIGLVAESILELADNLQVDLIVLTSHGRGRWHQLWLGSVADRILRTARHPLLLLRSPGSEAAPFPPTCLPNHVLIPLDGSPEAEGVFDVLRDICDPEAGRLTLASVLPRFATLVTPYPPELLSKPGDDLERESELHAYLASVEDRLKSWRTGSVEHLVVRDDDVARRVIGIAESEGVDLIALSTHGRQGLDRLILGSVVDKVVRGSRTAVLAVRRRGEP